MPGPAKAIFRQAFQVVLIEFGLIEEAGRPRVFGAGILPSIGEIPCLRSAIVERGLFVTDEVAETDYDCAKMQERLCVVLSFRCLREEVEHLVCRVNINRPGQAGAREEHS